MRSTQGKSCQACRGRRTIASHLKTWILQTWTRLLTPLLACTLIPPASAQDAPAYTLHANSNLALVDLTAVDRSTYLPDTTLTRDDLQVFDNGRAVPIAALDRGSDPAMRPVLLWLIVQCTMTGWTEQGSGFMASNAGALATGMTHLKPGERVAVAHWCDDGNVAVDLNPSPAHEAAIAAVDQVLQPVFSKPPDTRIGELALQAMIRQTQQVSRHADPQALPVLLFLHGDETGAPPREIDQLLQETLESSSMLFLLNDGAIRSWGGALPGLERARVLQYLAEQTGGVAMVAGDPRLNPGSYSDALAAILDRLHGRYQIGFVPRALDGKVHRLKVQLTPAAKRAHPHLLLRSRTVYRAPSRPGTR